MYGPEIPPEYQPFYDRLAAQSPVVTEGAAASQRPYQDFFNAYERMQQMRQPQRTGPFDLAPDQSNALDRLAAFGAALAGTRRSDFGGAFGEALQAMRQAGTAQRQEERQNRQLDVEAAYRAAQEARQLRELLQYEDPNSLRGRQLRAQIMELEARAEHTRRKAANVGAGGANLGTGISGTQNGRPGIYYPRTDTFRPFAEGFLPARTAQQEDAAERRAADLRLRIDNEAERRLNSNPATQLLEGEARRAAKNAIVRELETALTRQPGQQQQEAPTDGPEIRVRPF